MGKIKIKMNGNIEPTRIIREVASSFKIEPSQVISTIRTKENIRAKHIAMFCFRQLTNLSLYKIGEYFNGKNHATVIYAIHSVENQSNIYRNYKQKLDEIILSLAGDDLWEKYKYYETEKV